LDDKVEENETSGTYSILGEMRNAYRVSVGKSEMRGDFLEDLGIDRIILKWILKKFSGRLLI
jgi:hypothetical protein